jgi:hypothetical protein
MRAGDAHLGGIRPLKGSPPCKSPSTLKEQHSLARASICTSRLLKHPIKGFQVSDIDSGGRTVRLFIHPTIESARSRGGMDRRLRQLLDQRQIRGEGVTQ